MKTILIAMLGGFFAPIFAEESGNTSVVKFESPIVVQQQPEVAAENSTPAPPPPSGRKAISGVPAKSMPYEEMIESTGTSYNLHEVNEVLGYDSSFCCDDGCDRCGGDGCDSCCRRFRKRLCKKSSCNMPLHFAYFPDTHGYYYFHPYHHDHICHHIGLITIVGGDVRAPYSTEYFAKFYSDVLGVEAKRPQKLSSLAPTSEDANALPDLEELLK